MRDEGRGPVRLQDFVNHENARAADLKEAEVVALRLYTTSAYKEINQPLREEKKHPLPVTVMLIASGIKKLCSLNSSSKAATEVKTFWRGLTDIQLTQVFTERGGTEVCMYACMHVCMCVCVYIYIYIYMYKDSMSVRLSVSLKKKKTIKAHQTSINVYCYSS
jgi:hypothetical protein